MGFCLMGNLLKHVCVLTRHRLSGAWSQYKPQVLGPQGHLRRGPQGRSQRFASGPEPLSCSLSQAPQSHTPPRLHRVQTGHCLPEHLDFLTAFPLAWPSPCDVFLPAPKSAFLKAAAEVPLSLRKLFFWVHLLLGEGDCCHWWAAVRVMV